MNCEYCKAELSPGKGCRELYDQVAFYTLAHAQTDPFFIHQLVVDTYGAQHFNADSKPIAVAFALVGLYLFVEKGYTGRQVQLVHVELAREKRDYPAFVLPKLRGRITAR